MKIGKVGTLLLAGMIVVGGSGGSAAASSSKAGSGGAVVTSKAFAISAQEVGDLISSEAAKHQLFTKPFAQVRRELLDGLIDQKLASLDAERRKITSDPDLQVRIEAAIDAWMGGTYLSKVLNPLAEPTEEDLKPYTPKSFEKIRVLQLATEAEEEAARLRGQIVAGGDFGALAEEHSIAPVTPALRGALGWLTRGGGNVYPDDILEPLWVLRPGEVSQVLKTPVGYEIFRVEERVQLAPEEIEQVIAEPRARLRREKLDRLVLEACERQGMAVDAKGLDALASSQPPTDETVLGQVGTWKLTAGFYRRHLQSMKEDRRPPARNRAERQKVVEMILKQKSMRLELEARGFLDDPANRAIVDRFRKKTTADYAIEQLLAKVAPTEDDQRSYYLENRAKLPLVQRVRLKLIVVAEAARAEQIHRSLQSGADWDVLAGAYSVEQNAQKGGDLGWLFLHQVSSNYQKLAAELPPGTFTAPIQQGGRWVILKVAEREEPRTPTEQEGRGLLAKSVFEKKQQDFLKSYYAQLRREFAVKIDEAQLERISVAKPGAPDETLKSLPPGHPPTPAK